MGRAIPRLAAMVAALCLAPDGAPGATSTNSASAGHGAAATACAQADHDVAAILANESCAVIRKTGNIWDLGNGRRAMVSGGNIRIYGGGQPAYTIYRQGVGYFSTSANSTRLFSSGSNTYWSASRTGAAGRVQIYGSPAGRIDVLNGHVDTYLANGRTTILRTVPRSLSKD